MCYQEPTVPIRPFLEHHSFGPEDIARMSAALEAALSKLGLVDRSDPTTMAVAKLIIELAKQDEREPRAAVRLSVAATIEVARLSRGGFPREPLLRGRISPAEPFLTKVISRHSTEGLMFVWDTAPDTEHRVGR
jgi:hypothetical protein